MEAKDIPAELMSQIRNKFEADPKVKGLRTQQYLLQQKKDFDAALALGNVIEVLFGTVVQAYLDEVNEEYEEMEFKDVPLPQDDRDEIKMLNVTLFMAIDIMESCINDINDVLHRTDKTLNYEIHNDIKELSEMIQAKMKYMRENSEYENDLAWGERCDDMYKMMKNKASSLIRKHNSGNWGNKFQKYRK